MGRVCDVFYDASLWIYKIMILNVCFLSHVLMGGVIFGFGPAVIALFHQVKLWQEGGIDEPIWKPFHKLYKDVFKVYSLRGMFYLLVLAFLRWDIHLSLQIAHPIALMSTFLILFALYKWLLFGLYYASCEAIEARDLKEGVQKALALTFGHQKTNFSMAIGLALCFYLVIQMPALILFAAGVMPAYWSMKMTLNTLKKRGGTLWSENI